MARYLTKKILLSILTVFFILTAVFLLMRMMPTDYYFTEDQLQRLSQEQKEEMLRAAGLMDPILVQLKDYYVRLFTGDFGISRRIQAGVPVMELIGSRVGISAILGIISLILALVFGAALGVFQTMHKDKLGDHLGTMYVIFVDAVPTIVSLSIVLVIGTKIFHLPTMYSSRVYPIKSLIMPVLCLAIPSIAGYAMWTRRYMVDELNKDYIKLARMKGLSESQVMFRHVLKNAMVPMVQYLPISFLLTIGGSMLVESFFAIPGMGSLFTTAIQKYDLDVVQTLMFLFSTISIGGIILGDLLMTLVDPRIKLTDEGGVR